MRLFEKSVFARKEAISTGLRLYHQQIATLHYVTLAMTNKKTTIPDSPDCSGKPGIKNVVFLGENERLKEAPFLA
jgi:hypothetical protein